MELVRSFAAITADDVQLAGGKGASLGEMTQADIPVPPGFVVLSTAFDRLLEETEIGTEIDHQLHEVDHEDMNSVEQASEKIQGLIRSHPVPEDIEDAIREAFDSLDAEHVAVRSSATAEDSASDAWAGQLETFLNIEKNGLIDAVRDCWASLFTPRAIFYRFEKDLHGEDISVAVVVQEMVQSDVAGVAFSVHPVTEDDQQLIIEAGYGLGDAVVAGEITPDSFVVEKGNWELLEQQINEQDEGIYRTDDGNEWRDLDQGDEPTLSDKEVIELARLIVTIEDHYGFPVDVEWCHSDGEFFIVQSRPITTLTDTDDAEGGGSDPFDINPDRYVKLFNLNETLFTSRYEIESRKHLEQDGYPDIDLIYVKGQLYFDEGDLQKYAFSVERTNQVIDDVEERAEEFVRFCKKTQSLPDNADWYTLKDTYEEFHEVWDRYMRVVDMPIYCAHNLEPAFLDDFKDAGWSDDDFETIIEPLYRTFHQRREMDFARLANNEITREEFKSKWAWSNMTAFRYEPVDDAFIDEQLDQIKDPEAKKRELKESHEERERAYDELYEQLSPELQEKADLLQRLLYIRDYRFELLSKGTYAAQHFLRLLADEIGVTYKELTHMLPEEILNREVPEDLYKRMDEHAYVDDVVVGKEADDLYDLFNQQLDRDTVEGNGVSSGTATGTAKVVMTPDEQDKMNDGDILICDITTPDFMPAVKKARAIVANIGGFTSHTAIVAREFGIPCIVGTGDATQVFKDGDAVTVNADAGAATIQDETDRSWSRLVDRTESVLMYEYLVSGIDAERTKDVAGIDAGFENYLYLEGDIYWDEEEAALVSDAVDAFVEEHGYELLQEMVQQWIGMGEDLLATGERLGQEENAGKSGEELLQDFQAFTEKNKDLSTALLMPLVIEQHLTQQIESSLPESADALQSLTYPHRASESTKELHSFYTLASHVKEHVEAWKENEIEQVLQEQLHEEVEDYLDEFAWIEARWYRGTGWTVEDVVQRLTALDEQDFASKAHELDALVEENKETTARYVDEFDLDEELVETAKQYVYLRTFRTDMFNKAGYKARPFFREIAERLGLPYDELIYMTTDEIAASLREGELHVSKNEIAARKTGYAGIYDHGNIAILTGEDVHEYRATHELDHTAEKREVTGTAAHEGSAVGTVRLIEDTEDLDKVRHGDILVTAMTTPDFVPAMERAAAFVTDEGGITCHAAIVAREMGKPCLIGTEVATKLLEDGDRVEVDADAGVVRTVSDAPGRVRAGETAAFMPEEEYISVAARKIALPLRCVFAAGYSDSDNYEEQFGFSSEYRPMYDSEGHIFVNTAAMQHDLEQTKERLEEDEDFLENAAEQCYAIGDDLMEYSLELKQRDTKSMSDEELQEAVWKSFERRRYLSAYLLFPLAIEEYLNDSLREAVARHTDDVEEYYERLMVPARPNKGYHEQHRILELAQRYKDGAGFDDIQEELEEYLLEFDCLGVKYGYGEPWTEDDTKERIRYLAEQDVEERLRRHERMPEAWEEQVREALDELDADDDLQRWTKRVREYTHLRTFRTDVLSCSFANMYPILEEIGERNNLTLEQVKECLPSELMTWNFPEAETIEARAEQSLVRGEDGDVLYMHGDDVEQVKQAIIGDREETETAEELTGETAYEGAVTGTVKVVKNNQDLDKVQEGDIIVSPMTTPDFVPAMERAAGFVTDEGGILCHAAIVSREMQKPCIIGTGNATDVLEDGETVEVDADAGTVQRVGS